jgi:hypothetical protein
MTRKVVMEEAGTGPEATFFIRYNAFGFSVGLD